MLLAISIELAFSTPQARSFSLRWFRIRTLTVKFPSSSVILASKSVNFRVRAKFIALIRLPVLLPSQEQTSVQVRQFRWLGKPMLQRRQDAYASAACRVSLGPAFVRSVLAILRLKTLWLLLL